VIDLEALARDAEARIRVHVRETPIEASPVLSEFAGANVYLKLENLQVTNSFKARGAFNKLISLTPEERSRGFISASTGNHGAGVAYAAKKLGIVGIIFVPENASAVKIENIKRFGGEVRTFGVEAGITELHARAYANKNGMPFVSAYNDPLVIGGQATIGVEILRQLPTIDVVVAAIGGGGLISGIAGYLKAVRPELGAIGVSARNSMAMAESVRAGRIVETEHLATLADGVSGGLEPESITFDLCRALVDEFIDIEESDIRSALRLFIETHHMLCEGAAALAIAGLLHARTIVRGKTVVVVISGANISADTLRSAL
jgi:threonine dehydratase